MPPLKNSTNWRNTPIADAETARGTSVLASTEMPHVPATATAADKHPPIGTPDPGIGKDVVDQITDGFKTLQPGGSDWEKPVEVKPDKS